MFVATADTTVVMDATNYDRWLHEAIESRFRLWVTIGCDAISVIAIIRQLFALLLVPLCV